MPLYEYACKKCGRHHERLETFKGPHMRTCPSCGGRVEQLISAPALQFKGTGWYVTDYASKSATGEPARGDGNEPAKPAEAKDSSGGKDAKDTKGAKDGKDAKETKQVKETKEGSKSKSESKPSKEK
ncbi:MAG: FmdB family zinc ribbon protein [Candidatus Acidiferrales bacterium]